VNDNNNSDDKKPFSRKIYLLFNRFLFSVSRKHLRKDIQVAMLFSTKNENHRIAFSKIDEALNLISQFDPIRYRQIRRDVIKIWVSATPPYYAEWLGELQTCIIDREYIGRADVSSAEVATTIVHEATHARLDRAKIKYTQDVRNRVERICVSSEIAFAKRLPNGEQLIKNAEARLQIPETFWTNAEFQQRNLDALGELAKNNFVVRFLYRICKRWVKRRNALEKKDV
jgi:hypothetical protein